MNEKKMDVELKINRLNTVVYEEPKHFETSVSYKAYKEAFYMVKEIVRHNEELSIAKRNREKGTDLRNKEQIHNIIFFTGNRGTGKSSVMLSFMEFLKDYYRNQRTQATFLRDIPEFDLGKQDVMFTGLDYIDASMLESKEDILGTVLSKMAKKWHDEEQYAYGESGIIQDLDYDYNKRKIQLQFNTVYECLKDLIRSKEDIMKNDNDMFIETLEKLSFTGNLKQAFQELVIRYLNIMKYPGTEGKINDDNHFLVIPIDDVDMDIEHSFSLLEQIRKYLMVPNVIVLLSADYEQLENICISHYTKQYHEVKDRLEMNGCIGRLSREYLEKMVPIQRQIEMKSGQKWDFFERKKLRICYFDEKENREQTFGENSVKEIIREKFQELFAAEFGRNSKALFYLAPKTLRETVGVVKQILLLEETDIEDRYIWFWNQEFPALCKRYLDRNERLLFAEIEQLPLKGKIRRIKEIFWPNEVLQEYEGSLIGFFALLLDEITEQQALYYFCIVYFTMKLSEVPRKEQCLEEYYKEGIWGIWEKEFIAPMSFGPTAELYKIARIESLKLNGGLTLELDVDDAEFSRDNMNEVLKIIERNKENLINFQHILLFYDLNMDIEKEWVKIWKFAENKKIIPESQMKGIFSLSNFILNLDKKNNLVDKFLDEVSDILYTGDSVKEKEMIKSRIQELSILKGLSGEKSLIPLNNIEYLIDTGNYIQEELGKLITVELNKDNIGEKIKQYIKLLQNSLRLYEEIYSAEEWEKQFIDNAVVKKINDDEKFIEMLSMSIMAIAEPEVLIV